MAKPNKKRSPKSVPHDPRKLPTQSRSKATVDAIIEAATHILREQGLQALSTNKVAEMAGVSIGSLYQYFPNKDAIMVALAIASHDRMQVQLFAALSAAASEPIDRALDLVLTQIAAWRASDPKLLSAIDNYIPTVTEQAEVVNFLDQSSTAVVETFLRARGDEIGVTDYAAAAFLLVHTIQPLAQRLHALQLRDPERVPRVRAELHKMIIGYIRGAPRSLQDLDSV